MNGLTESDGSDDDDTADERTTMQFTDYLTGNPIQPNNAQLTADELIAKVLPVLQADDSSWRAIATRSGVSFSRENLVGSAGSSSVNVSPAAGSSGVFWSLKLEFRFPKGGYGTGSGAATDDNIHEALLRQWKAQFEYERVRWTSKRSRNI